MAYRIIYHPEAEAELDGYRAGSRRSDSRRLRRRRDQLHRGAGDVPERGTVRESRITALRIIGYRRSVSVAFSVRGNDVFILGVFAHGRDITDEILEGRA